MIISPRFSTSVFPSLFTSHLFGGGLSAVCQQAPDGPGFGQAPNLLIS